MKLVTSDIVSFSVFLVLVILLKIFQLKVCVQLNKADGFISVKKNCLSFS